MFEQRKRNFRIAKNKTFRLLKRTLKLKRRHKSNEKRKRNSEREFKC